MQKKLALLSLTLPLSIIALVGCGATPSKESSASVNNEPVTLTVWNVPDTEFQKYFVEPTKKKYPNITLQQIKNGKGTSLEDLIAAGQTPDLIFSSNGYFSELKQDDVMQDLTPYINKYHVDLNLYDKSAVDVIKRAGEHGEIYSIPYTMNYGILLYNKDIFDKFGVPYPKDLMSWEELLPLAQKLTRKEDNVQYIGLEPGNADVLASELGVPKVGANNVPNLLTPEYNRVFSFLKRIFEIPGQIGPNNQTSWSRNTDFLKNQNVAMITDWANDAVAPLEAAYTNGFNNWDVSGLPNFQDHLGYGRGVDEHLTFISKTSQHKEQAFQVLMETVSKETQMEVSAGGLISAMNDKDVQNNFGKDLKSFQGKHLQNIFKTKMTIVPPEGMFGSQVYKIIRDEQKNMALGEDVNTALRNAQDRALKNVQEEQNSSK